MIYSAVLLSLLITMVLVPVFRRLAVKMQALDLPNERKVHALPMPKTGGVAMAAGMMIPVVIWAPTIPLPMPLQPLLLASGVIVAFGFLDDLKDLNFRIKFAAQIAAALTVVGFGQLRISSLGMLLPEGIVLPGVVAILLTVFVIVGVTNAINLADGLDGLAGGISLLTFICLGALAWQADRPGMVLVAASMSGAIFGFLRFNTYPASVFMGDAGSQLLGFVAITLAISLTQNSSYSPLLPMMLLGFPVFDTLRVMGERVRNGLPPFKADRNHFHHKLLGSGLTHSEAVLVIYLFQGTLTLAAWFLRFHSDWLLLAGYLGFSAVNLTILLLIGKYGWALRLPGSPQRRLARLGRLWRTSAVGIRISYPGLGWLLVSVTVLHLLLVGQVPVWAGWLALGCNLLLASAHLLPPAVHGFLLRAPLYALAPYLVYVVQLQGGNAISLEFQKFLPGAFLLMGFLAVLVIRWTRRKRYQPTPLDVLVLVIALVVPCFPGFDFDRDVMVLVATKTIVLFFGFEVYLVEKRSELSRLKLLTAAALTVLAVKAFAPIVF